MQPDQAVWTELSYLEQYGEQGPWTMPAFAAVGCPWAAVPSAWPFAESSICGSRATASVGTEADTEGMLVLHCLVLSNRWDDTFAHISAPLPGATSNSDWTYCSDRMPAQLKAGIPIGPPVPQPSTPSSTCATAA